jgi:hypothetical protein
MPCWSRRATSRRWRRSVSGIATPSSTIIQLVLDRHACLSIAGAWGESQFLGDLRDRPGALAGTALAHVSPAQLPRHEQAANPMLQPYEAVVLVSAIRA